MRKTAIVGQRDLLLAVVHALAKQKMPFLLTGSFAVSYYGYPRATHDVDFVVELQKTPRHTLRTALMALGKGFLWDPHDVDIVSSGGLMTLYHTDTATKVDFFIIDASDFSEKYSRSHRITLDDHPISMVSAEDLILTKLSWCKEVASERHMRDCVGMWQVQKGHLDEVYLTQKAKEYGVTDLLARVAAGDVY